MAAKTTDRFYQALKAGYEGQFYDVAYITNDHGSMLQLYQFEIDGTDTGREYETKPSRSLHGRRERCLPEETFRAHRRVKSSKKLCRLTQLSERTAKWLHSLPSSTSSPTSSLSSFEAIEESTLMTSATSSNGPLRLHAVAAPNCKSLLCSMAAWWSSLRPSRNRQKENSSRPR